MEISPPVEEIDIRRQKKKRKTCDTLQSSKAPDVGSELDLELSATQKPLALVEL